MGHTELISPGYLHVFGAEEDNLADSLLLRLEAFFFRWPVMYRVYIVQFGGLVTVT